MATMKTLNGYGFDSAKLGGKAPEYYIQPRNLLDNSDFTNPVNQRGKTSYTANGYTIDRWELWNGAVYVTDSGYISTTGQLYQRIDIPTDKTYTFAIKTGDGIAVAAGIPEIGASMTLGNAAIALTTINGYVEVVIQPASADAAGAVWAALYEGSYTADTLPPYVPKGKHVEMLNCGVSLTPHNLLDNSDFTRFIAQAEIMGTHGAAQYAGDRWKMNSGTVTGIANAYGDGYTDITLQTNSRFEQVVAGIDKYYGQPMTAALWLKNGSVIVGSAIVNAPTEDYLTPISVGNDNTHIYLQATTGDARVYLFIVLTYGNSETVVAAALLPGSYTVDTLPPYVPKGYAAEFAECRRYYKRFTSPNAAIICAGYVTGGTKCIYFNAPDNQPMRIVKPSCTFTGLMTIRGINGYIAEDYSDAVIRVYANATGCISMMEITRGDSAAWNATNNTPVFVNFHGNSVFELIADL